MYGASTVFDTTVARTMPIGEYGEDNAYENIQAFYKAHSDYVKQMLSSLVDQHDKPVRSYGDTNTKTVEEVDEIGTPLPQRKSTRFDQGFSLRRFKISDAWTEDFMERATVGDVEQEAVATITADLRLVKWKIQQALFTATNSTFNDRWGPQPNIALPVRAFYNADGGPIKVGPQGQTFDGTSHTHYAYNATLTEAAVDALLLLIYEHNGQQDGLRLLIPKAAAATFATFSKFVADQPASYVFQVTDTKTMTPLDVVSRFDREIGTYDSNVRVCIREFMPTYYIFAHSMQAEKPLAIREPTIGVGSKRQRGLYMYARHQSWGLASVEHRHDFDINVLNRCNGALLYYNSGSAYTAPTITRP